MTDIRLKISPPWVTYVNQLIALFKEDPEIQIVYDNDEMEVKLFVDNAKKAEALTYLLPYQEEFGNVILDITIIPSNKTATCKEELITMADYFVAAFENNPVFSFYYEVNGIFSNTLTYIVFKNEVVQFFNDNLNDIYGNISTLYQEIAKDIFDPDVLIGVLFCTDRKERSVGMPLGEWP